MSFANVCLGVGLLWLILPSFLFYLVTMMGFGWLWYFTSSGMSLRRKMAIATWSSSESAIYAKMSVDMTEALKYIEELRQKSNEKVTVAHIVGRAVGLGLQNSGGLNGRIVFGRHVQNQSVDVSFLVDIDGGKNLAPTLIQNVDEKDSTQICRELKEKAQKLRTDKDDDFKKTMNLVNMLPTFLLRPVSRLIGILSGDLGIGCAPLGLRPRPFGSCMISNVGTFGVEEAFAPFTPFARVPLLILLGTVKDEVVVRNGEITTTKLMKIMATIDHRYIDGITAAQIGKRIRDYLENPTSLDLKQKKIQLYPYQLFDLK